MPNDDVLPKSATQQIKEQQVKIAALEKAVEALLVAAKEWNDVTGRECMPEGTYFGVSF